MVPGQDGGRAGRGVDLNQLKLDWITSETQRLKQRILRIDIDFNNSFNSMYQNTLWAVMRAYNLPDIDLLEAIYSRTTACMDPEDTRCATITFLTGVIKGERLLPASLLSSSMPCWSISRARVKSLVSVMVLQRPSSSTMSPSWMTLRFWHKTMHVGKFCSKPRMSLKYGVTRNST